MMDTKKAIALHRYYEELKLAQPRRSMLNRKLTQAGIQALDDGCSDEELEALSAIAGCEWAPEWAKERYER